MICCIQPIACIHKTTGICLHRNGTGMLFSPVPVFCVYDMLKIYTGQGAAWIYARGNSRIQKLAKQEIHSFYTMGSSYTKQNNTGNGGLYE